MAEAYMTTDAAPKVHRLDEILLIVRDDLLNRTHKLADDHRPEAKHVMRNNVRILNLLTEAIGLAQDSSKLLSRSFGPPLGKRHTDRALRLD